VRRQTVVAMRSTLYKLSGAALIGSFVLSVAGGALHPIVGGQSHSVASLTAPASPYAQLLIYAGAVLLTAGLPAMFVFLAPRVGRIGIAGIVLYFLGNLLSVQGHLVVEAFVAPAIAKDPAARHLISSNGEIIASDAFIAFQIVGGMVFIAAMVLLGIGLFRSGVVPKWVGALLVAGAASLFFPLPEVPVLTGLHIEVPRGLAVAVVGLAMIRAARSVAPSDARPAPHRTLAEV
jgi:hypothetical protein